MASERRVRRARMEQRRENTGTFRGERIAYRAVYAPLLEDGLVLRGRRIYDQSKLLAPLVKDLPAFGRCEPTWTGAVAGAPAQGSGDRVSMTFAPILRIKMA